MAGWATRSVDEIPKVTVGESDDPDWYPLQHFLGLTTFGANVFVAARANGSLRQRGRAVPRAPGTMLLAVGAGEGPFSTTWREAHFENVPRVKEEP
jgi:hypothetical protein